MESTAATKKTIPLGFIINRAVCITVGLVGLFKNYNFGASIRHHSQLGESINNTVAMKQGQRPAHNMRLKRWCRAVR